MSDLMMEKRRQSLEARRRERIRLLCEEIKRHPGQIVYQLAFALDLPESFITKVLDTEPECIALVQQYQVAVPARSLRDPKWARHVEDTSLLPRVNADEKISSNMLVTPDTGNQVIDSDISAMERGLVDVLRHVPARKARAQLNEMNILIGRLAQNTRKLVDDTVDMPMLRDQLALAKRQLKEVAQRIRNEEIQADDAPGFRQDDQPGYRPIHPSRFGEPRPRV